MIIDELPAYAHDQVEANDSRKAKQLIAILFWRWFDSNRDRKLTTIKIWFIKKIIYVRDLRDVFVALFGNPPTNI